MLAVSKKIAYTLLAALLLLSITLVSSARANAQGVSSATVTATTDGYFECAASGIITIDGVWGNWWYEIYLDGHDVDGYVSDPLTEGTMVPFDIDVTVPLTGGPLYGEHTCEFVGWEQNAFIPPTPPVSTQLWDVKYTYDFP